jgi:hypothetical protein
MFFFLYNTIVVKLLIPSDVDELEHVDRDFLCDLLNTNKSGRQMLFGLNGLIDVVLKVLSDRMFVDMYHNDNRSDVQY